MVFPSQNKFSSSPPKSLIPTSSPKLNVEVVAKQSISNGLHGDLRSLLTKNPSEDIGMTLESING